MNAARSIARFGPAGESLNPKSEVGGGGHSLWILQLRSSATAAPGPNWSEVTVEAQVAGATKRFGFLNRLLNQGEAQPGQVVGDPLRVLLSAPAQVLAPGHSESLALLAPEGLEKPTLVWGELRIELETASTNTARLPEDLPMVALPLSERTQ